MNILRKMVISLFAGLLGVTLFGMAWANVGLATIHDRQTVKSWFAKSNFYGQVVDVVLEQAKAGTKDASGSFPITNPAIQAAAKQAFNPVFLEKNVNGVLDGTYSWLDGSANDLNIKIDLTSAKQQLATGVGTYVENRVTTLPVCAAGISGTNGFDGFSAVCRPPAMSAAQAGTLATADFLKQDFLKDPVITADTLKGKADDGSSVPITSDKKVTSLKTAYERSSQLPIVLGALALLFALGIIFISRDRLKGIRRVGYSLLTTGIILLAIYGGIGAVYAAAADKFSSGDTTKPVQTKLILDFAKVVVNDVKSALVVYVAGFIGLGLAAIITITILKKRQKGPKKPKADKHEAPEEAPKNDQEQPMHGVEAVDANNQVPMPQAAPPIPEKRKITLVQ